MDIGVQGVAVPHLESQMRQDYASNGCCSFAGTEIHICNRETVSNCSIKLTTLDSRNKR